MRRYLTILFLLMVSCHPVLAADNTTSLAKPNIPQSQEQDAFYNHPLMTSENPSSDHFISEFISMLMVLSFTLVVMLVIAWALKRFLYQRLQQGNANSSIRVEEQRNLSPKAMIYLIEIEGVRMIIGESPSGLVRLGELPADKEGTSFSDILNK